MQYSKSNKNNIAFATIILAICVTMSVVLGQLKEENDELGEVIGKIKEDNDDKKEELELLTSDIEIIKEDLEENKNTNKNLREKNKDLKEKVEKYEKSLSKKDAEIEKKQKKITNLTQLSSKKENVSTQSSPASIPKEDKKKSANSSSKTMVVTAYTAGAESTGKSEGHPNYGKTASGKQVQTGVTIACPPSLPFGTRVHIEGVGERVCHDRGGDIVEGRLDVYMPSLTNARSFGRKTLNVSISK